MIDKPKIMHISLGYGKAGIERKIVSVSDALSDRFEFAHLGLFDCGKVHRSFEERGLKSYYAGLRELPMMQYPLYFLQKGKIAEIFNNFKPDLVHLYHPPLQWWLGSVAKSFGAAVVLEACNANIYRRRKLAAFVERIGFHYVDRGIAISRYVRERYAREFGVNPDNFEIIYNGTNTELFRPAKSDEKNQMHRELDIQKDNLIIAASGRLIPRKGFHVFLDAIEKLSKCDIPRTFLIIGDGPQRDELEARAKEIDEQILFTGYRNDVEKVLRACDIYVCPSLHEEFGQVLTEGMACGLACIASQTGGFLEIAENETDALTYPKDDSKSLAHKIQYLIENGQARVQLGIKAREKVMAKFTIQRMIEEKAILYEKLLSPNY